VILAALSVMATPVITTALYGPRDLDPDFGSGGIVANPDALYDGFSALFIGPDDAGMEQGAEHIVNGRFSEVLQVARTPQMLISGRLVDPRTPPG
jgi:hypothetical protein